MNIGKPKKVLEPKKREIEYEEPEPFKKKEVEVEREKILVPVRK